MNYLCLYKNFQTLNENRWTYIRSNGDHRPENFIIVIENNRQNKLNESAKDTSAIDTLGDICLELKDEGYNIEIEQDQSNRKKEYDRRIYIDGGYITVEVSKEESFLDGYTHHPFSFVKVKESFNRMISFMKSDGYDYDLLYLKNKIGITQWERFSGKNDTKHRSYRIIFYKKSISQGDRDRDLYDHRY